MKRNFALAVFNMSTEPTASRFARAVKAGHPPAVVGLRFAGSAAQYCCSPLIAKTSNLILVLIALALFASSYSAAAGQPETATRVIAFVVDIENGRPPPYQEFVTVFLTINSPAELAGSRFVLVTKSHERRAIRSQFPLGSLQAMAWSKSVVAALIKQRSDQEGIERQIDKGIDRKVISTIIMLPEVNISDLPSPPTAVSGTP